MRKALNNSKSSVPGRTGRATKNPTLKWAFELMADVVNFKINIFNKTGCQIKGIGPPQKTIISCFGTGAEVFYGFP